MLVGDFFVDGESLLLFPSVLCYCWFDNGNGIQPVKTGATYLNARCN